MDKKEIVDAIIGDIWDPNFSDEELENCYLSDEEVAEIDKDYKEALASGEIPEITPEQAQRGKDLVSSLIAWSFYKSACVRLGVFFYDYQEWANLTEKPEEPNG